MSKAVLIATAAAGMLLLMTSCNQSAAHQSQEVSVATGPALHMINNARLREIMRKLSNLDLYDIASEMEDTGEPHPQLRMVAEMAVPLARDARLMSISFRDRTMSSETRRIFDSLAIQLGDESKDLVEAAKKNDLREAQIRLQRVIATCNACHASFRGPSIAGWLQ